MMRTDDAYTMEEVVTILDCSEDAVVARINSGELAAEKFGRGWVFPREAFRESINAIAREAAARRRAERDAKGKATTVIRKAKEPQRRRTPPALPSF